MHDQSPYIHIAKTTLWSSCISGNMLYNVLRYDAHKEYMTAAGTKNVPAAYVFLALLASYFATVVQKRCSRAALAQRWAFPPGFRVPSSLPLNRPAATAHCIAVFA